MRQFLHCPRLALAENLPCGIYHEPGVHDRGIDRDQDGEPIFPRSTALDAAIDAHAISTDGLYLPNGRAEKFRNFASGDCHSGAPRSSSFLSLPCRNHDGKKPQRKSRFEHTTSGQLLNSSHAGCSISEPYTRACSSTLTLPGNETKKTLATHSARDTARKAPAATPAPSQRSAAGATISTGAA